MLHQMNRSGRFGAKGDTVNTTHKIKAATATLTVGFLLAIALAATAPTAFGREGMTAQQRQAVQQQQAVRARAEATNRFYQLGVYSPEVLRSQATNRFYNLGTLSWTGVATKRAEELRSQATNRFYNLGTTGAATQQGEKLRAEAMNRVYHLGVYSPTGVLRALERRSEATNRFYHTGSDAVVSTSSPFDWSNVGIGVGGALGLIILAGAMTVVVRRRPSSPSTT
jgi:hypothetical protein